MTRTVLFLFYSFSFAVTLANLGVNSGVPCGYNGSAAFTQCGYSVTATDVTVYVLGASPVVYNLKPGQVATVVGYSSYGWGGCGCNSFSISASAANASGIWTGDNSCIANSYATWNFFCSIAFSVDDVVSPCDHPFSNPAGAQAFLSARQAECEVGGGVYSSEVAPQENGDWCVEDACESRQEEEESGECPEDIDGSFMQKNGASKNNSESFSPGENSADYRSKAGYTQGKPALFYDALGRKTEPRPEIRRRLFEWKNMDSVFDRDRDFVLAEGTLFRLVYEGDTCGVKGIDYGIIDENGRLQGGYYCHFLKMDVSKGKAEWHSKADHDSLCGKNDKLVNGILKYRYKPVIAKDSILYMKKGEVFPNGYETTEQDEIYFINHERRHQRDTKKIIRAGTEKEILINKAMCKSEFCEWKTATTDSLHNETKKELNFYNAKIDSAAEYYHDQCYNHGNC